MKRGIRTTLILLAVVATMSLVLSLEAYMPPIGFRGTCQQCNVTVYLYPTGNRTPIFECGPAMGPAGAKVCYPDVNGCWMGNYCLYA